MATKYQTITGLYESTLKQVTQNPAAWTAFLCSACRNYKLRFDDQILVYAQRPDATAVLEIERWNKSFGRWVNKGAKGIAIFDDEHDGNYRLKHYFDVSDTHESRFVRPVPIWQMRPEYEAEVIESLENSFGDLDNADDLANALMSAAINAVEDNKADYLRDLVDLYKDSFAEELDELNIDVEYSVTLRNSVAYMLLTRCGLNADEYFIAEDFQYLYKFSTRETVNALGIATSDIAELCLREIAATVLNLQRQNRTFAEPENGVHNNVRIQKDGRSVDHDRNSDISDGGGLPGSESDRAGGRRNSSWQIRVDAKEASPAEPPRPVPELPDGGDAERTLDGDRADGQRDDGIIDHRDGADRGRDGGIESPQSNDLGSSHEQFQASCRRDFLSGSYIYLNGK